jgi:hypothetical protein
MDPGFPNASLSARAGEKVKAGLWTLLTFALFGVLVGLGFAFIYGLVWISAKLLPIVEFLSAIGGAALVLCLLPSAIFRGSRRFCGNGIVLVSYVWGIALWMYATLVLYDHWGAVGMFLGFILMGFGSVPLAGIACLFRWQWGLIGTLVLDVIIIWITRLLGHWIASKGEPPSNASGY